MELFKKKNNINKPSKHEREVSLSIGGTSPRADWVITVIGIAVILIVLLTWSWKLFSSINNGTFFEVSSGTKTSKNVVDEEKLERIVERFEVRAERFDKLTGGMVLSSFSSNESPDDNVSTTTPETEDNVDLEE